MGLIPYKDAGGRVADFHSLRHTYISNLARAGIHPKTAMDLARHGDINLTLARYSHTVVADRASALAALPTLTEDAHKPERQKATGTYDSSAEMADTLDLAVSRPVSQRALAAEPLAFSGHNDSSKRFPKPQVTGSNPVGRSGKGGDAGR